MDFFRYSYSLREDGRFSLIIDDQVHQEIQNEMECRVVDLGIGLGCDYVLIRGCAKPERIAQINYFAATYS